MPETPARDETPLWEASASQITDELFRRFDAVVLVTETRGRTGDAEDPPLVSYSGGYSRMLGILARVQYRMMSATPPLRADLARV